MENWGNKDTTIHKRQIAVSEPETTRNEKLERLWADFWKKWKYAVRKMRLREEDKVRHEFIIQMLNKNIKDDSFQFWVQYKDSFPPESQPNDYRLRHFDGD